MATYTTERPAMQGLAQSTIERIRSIEEEQKQHPERFVSCRGCSERCCGVCRDCGGAGYIRFDNTGG